MVSLQGIVSGEMQIGCSTAAGKYLLPGLIAIFRKHFSMVRVNVLVTSRKSALEKLIIGELNLALSSKKIKHKGLEYKTLFKDEIILIAPEDHK